MIRVSSHGASLVKIFLSTCMLGLGGDDKALGMFKPLQESTMITGGRGFYPNKRVCFYTMHMLSTL